MIATPIGCAFTQRLVVGHRMIAVNSGYTPPQQSCAPDANVV